MSGPVKAGLHCKTGCARIPHRTTCFVPFLTELHLIRMACALPLSGIGKAHLQHDVRACHMPMSHQFNMVCSDTQHMPALYMPTYPKDGEDLLPLSVSLLAALGCTACQSSKGSIVANDAAMMKQALSCVQ